MAPLSARAVVYWLCTQYVVLNFERTRLSTLLWLELSETASPSERDADCYGTIRNLPHSCFQHTMKHRITIQSEILVNTHDLSSASPSTQGMTYPKRRYCNYSHTMPLLFLCYHANYLFVVHVKANWGSRLEWSWFLRFAESISPQAWRCFIGQYIPR
jgi:hypothetical protein